MAEPGTIGVLHPGAMGSAVGAHAVAAGRRVVWASEDRSEATEARASADGLEDLTWVNGVVNQSELILSICPPAAAEDVANEVAGLGFRGIYADCNAVAPATARSVAAIVEASGATYVDGGIIGGPPRREQTTRLYLSGEGAAKTKSLLGEGPLEIISIEGGPGAASALKMAYAAWTKGTSALLADIHALALAEGIHDDLVREWSRSQPALLARSDRGLPTAAAKAWRFVGEMEEIAKTFGDSGLPDGFHLAAAEVYRRLERFKDDPEAPGGAALAQHLLPGEAGEG
jgi:3-hydroxyisobutyrate dehydrogenase-like beta-hydroxyacid dehydrogenase